MKSDYHTSFLKNLILRIEKAAKGAIRFIDDDNKTSLDVAVIFSFDFGLDFNPSQARYDFKQCQWLTIAENRSHPRDRRYMFILNYIIDDTFNPTSSVLNVQTVLGFAFSSIEELDMKLSINGY